MASRAIALALSVLMAAPAFGRDPAVSEPMAGCGTFNYDREHIGPLDYRQIDPKVLKLIEDYHFTRKVEMLREGQASTLGGDLAYTLNAIPNHPRALRTTAEYFRRSQIHAQLEMGMGIDCWFERAVAYRPDDPIVRILFADQMLKQGKRDEATHHLRVAEQNTRDSATVHYNLGLLYLDLKEYDRSVEHAQKAYELGAPLPGLRNLLARAGKWPE
jgi:tetratricopeptide (TPR) repeat protein